VKKEGLASTSGRRRSTEFTPSPKRTGHRTPGWGGALIVSADTTLVAALTLALSRALSSTSAVGLSAALRNLTESKPQLVVLDVHALDADAVCFLRALAVMRRGHQVLVLTGSEDALAHQTVTALELAGVLRKPCPLDAIVDRLDATLRLRGGPALLSVRYSPHVRRAIEYLIAHYTEPLRVARTSQAAGVSQSHLVHLFTAETGMSLRRYQTCLRVEAAKHRLAQTDEKLEVIAEETGFCDSSHLCRALRRVTGGAPRDYRVARRDTGSAQAAADHTPVRADARVRDGRPETRSYAQR